MPSACPHCGTALDMHMLFCWRCGSPHASGAVAASVPALRPVASPPWPAAPAATAAPAAPPATGASVRRQLFSVPRPPAPAEQPTAYLVNTQGAWPTFPTTPAQPPSVLWRWRKLTEAEVKAMLSRFAPRAKRGSRVAPTPLARSAENYADDEGDADPNASVRLTSAAERDLVARLYYVELAKRKERQRSISARASAEARALQGSPRRALTREEVQRLGERLSVVTPRPEPPSEPPKRLTLLQQQHQLEHLYSQEVARRREEDQRTRWQPEESTESDESPTPPGRPSSPVVERPPRRLTEAEESDLVGRLYWKARRRQVAAPLDDLEKAQRRATTAGLNEGEGVGEQPQPSARRHTTAGPLSMSARASEPVRRPASPTNPLKRRSVPQPVPADALPGRAG